MSYSNYWNIDMFTHFPYALLGTVILSILAYFIGSLNGGQILSIVGPKNLGDVGTKNFGATNAGRAYGKIGFIGVFIFDMLKAVFAGLILNSIAHGGGKVFSYANVPLALIFVIIGHSWPIYFEFKGGKGVATSFGCIIMINWLFAMISIGIFILVVYYTRRVSIGSIISTSVGTLLIILFQGVFKPGGKMIFDWSHNWTIIFSSLIVWLLVMIRHRENILRIINKEDELVKPKKPQNKNEYVLKEDKIKKTKKESKSEIYYDAIIDEDEKKDEK